MIFFIGNRFFYSAKKNLFKDQAAWSGKDIKIKYKRLKELSDSTSNKNYLKMVADESKIFLDNQNNKEDNEK